MHEGITCWGTTFLRPSGPRDWVDRPRWIAVETTPKYWGMPSGARAERNRANSGSTKTERKRAKGESTVLSTKIQQLTLNPTLFLYTVVSHDLHIQYLAVRMPGKSKYLKYIALYMWSRQHSPIFWRGLDGSCTWVVPRSGGSDGRKKKKKNPCTWSSHALQSSPSFYRLLKWHTTPLIVVMSMVRLILSFWSHA